MRKNINIDYVGFDIVQKFVQYVSSSWRAVGAGAVSRGGDEHLQETVVSMSARQRIARCGGGID
jgi:hypothetical protein